MDRDGTSYEARGAHADPVPRPATPPAPPAPPPVPAVPPLPRHAPRGAANIGARSPRPSVVEWLDAPRGDAGPGIWRLGYVPPRPPKAGRRLAPETIFGLAVPLVVGVLLWTLWARGQFPYKTWLLQALTPREWWWPGSLWPMDDMWQPHEALYVYDNAFLALLVYTMGRLGGWPAFIRHLLGRWEQLARAGITVVGALVALAFLWTPVVKTVLSLLALLTGGYAVFQSLLINYGLYVLTTLALVWPFARVGEWRELLRRRRAAGSCPADLPDTEPPSRWPQLRDAEEHKAADLLSGDLLAGRMNDVDCARIRRAWHGVRGDAARLASFTETVLRHGSAAWVHPSGARDLPVRMATHDLLVDQVRIGRYTAGERTPPAYRDAHLALDRAVLGTSLLAVGPSGSGKTEGLIKPVVESLALQALTGSCAVVAVGTADTRLGLDAGYDVVLRPGDPASRHDLDLYAGTTDPDEAASFLAEGLVGHVETIDTRRSATVIAQLIGPYQAAHSRFPTVPVLRELLEGRPETLAALLDLLSPDSEPAMRRELETRIRQAGTAADVGPVLADRLSLLDRPVFADFFGGGGDVRPFSLRAIAHHPLRVRIDLPERGHEEASRLLARLLLAQFMAVVRTDGRRGHFACLVLDDAAGTLTTETVRGIQRLRAQNAGVVLALRTLSDVPEALHGPLHSAVGCRVALSGVTTWDGRRFAEAWGTEWVETTEVAKHTVFADQPMTRAIHALRKVVTGKAVTTDAVTVRQVERERWSASELAHGVPAGHAVVSLTTVRGEHAPPLLVDLLG